MSAFGNAFTRASLGLDWSYPCLIWVADYLREATGTDFAAEWRSMAMDEPTAKRELARLAVEGDGGSAVERALSGLAKRFGWPERDVPRQGSVMIGVYADIEGEGVPAIFDRQRRWLIAGLGNATVTPKPPDRMWEIMA